AGRVTANSRLVEPTSGNTGLGLSMMTNALGYPFSAVLSKRIPLEKRAVLKFFGTDVRELDDDLCPAPGAPEGAIAQATKAAEDDPDTVMLDQYKNEANPDAHYRTTGPEIWKQTQGGVTHFVAGLGTCGTITGTGRFLKEQNEGVAVMGVYPEEGHDIPGVRSLRQLQQTKIFSPNEYDRMVEVTNDEAYEMCRRLVQEESIVAGPSSGLALVGALKMVPDEPGNVVVVVFPDNVFKYASSLIRHFPDMFANTAGAMGTPSPTAGMEQIMVEMVENTKTSGNTIDVNQAVDAMESGEALFVDVRSEKVYEAAHVKGAVSVPLEEMSRSQILPTDKSAPIVTVCNVGKSSLIGMLYLNSMGYTNVKSMDGGTEAWIEAGLPVESGETR
ncbi:MAG TPA: pyridoxal-phosphate dependent enzyme, partial [Fimbriimonadaceae bacterium]|nr:pyridoxal-phosphate dependent enzyme [Fimbriimonadaceae bacterium]